MFTATLCTIAKTWKYTQMSINMDIEWIMDKGMGKEDVYIYNAILFSHMKEQN